MMEDFYSAEVCRQYPRTGNIFTQNYEIRRGAGVKGKFEIKQVYPIWKNNGKGFFIPDNVERDIKQFEAYLEARKKVMVGKGNKKDKLRKVAELEKKFGPFDLD